MADEGPWTKYQDEPWAKYKQPVKAEPKASPTITSETRKIMSKINEDSIAGTLGAPVDWVNGLLKKMGAPTSEKPFLGSESIKSGMRAVGASSEGEEPETITGRAVADVGGGAISAMLGGGGMGAAARGVGEALAMPGVKAAGDVLASPAGNIAAGAGAGGGGAIAAEPFRGTPSEEPARALGELVGGFAGGIAPATSLRPPKDVDAVIGAYERLKLAPSAAEAGVGGRAAQWLEGNALPQTIGGGGVMERFKQKRLKEITGIQQSIADQYGAAKPRAEMGKSIQESVMDSWTKTKDENGKLIGQLRVKYAPDIVYPSNVIEAATKPVGAAESQSIREQTLDPLVLQTQKSIRETGGNVRFSDLTALKALYGGAMEPGFQKNVNDAQVSQLFHAVNKDIENHIKSRSPEDFELLKKSNQKYGQAQDDFRKYFKKLVGSKNVPVSSERAYEILTAAASDKARGNQQEFKNVWEALPAEERGNLSATILSRLGSLDMSNVGNPETWSMGKFISGYDQLSSEAKDMLFKGNKDVSRELDDLNSVVRNINNRLAKLASTSKSGTGGMILGQFGVGAAMSYLGTGNFKAFMLTMGGPYVMAEMLTNPMAVKAVSNAMRVTEAALDASARAAVAMEAIPKLPQPKQKQAQ